jgi:hypothetical protein
MAPRRLQLEVEQDQIHDSINRFRWRLEQFSEQNRAIPEQNRWLSFFQR